MKRFILFLLIIQIASVMLFPFLNGERNRFFLITGGGYAFSNPAGPLVEAGVEVRVFGNVHARLLLNHYFGKGVPIENELIENMNSVSLYGVYGMQLTEILDFRIKLGAHFTAVQSELTVLGITFSSTKANIGAAGGIGFSLQLNNFTYFYTEATVKYLFFEEPWTWAEVQGGLMFRLR